MEIRVGLRSHACMHADMLRAMCMHAFRWLQSSSSSPVAPSAEDSWSSSLHPEGLPASQLETKADAAAAPVDPIKGAAAALGVGPLKDVSAFLHGPRDCVGQALARVEMQASI